MHYENKHASIQIGTKVRHTNCQFCKKNKMLEMWNENILFYSWYKFNDININNAGLYIYHLYSYYETSDLFLRNTIKLPNIHKTRCIIKEPTSCINWFWRRTTRFIYLQHRQNERRINLNIYEQCLHLSKQNVDYHLKLSSGSSYLPYYWYV